MSGSTSHRHGPSIFGASVGYTGLPYQWSVFIFSRIPSKGERLEMLLRERSNHVKLAKSASGDISDMLFSRKSLAIPS